MTSASNSPSSDYSYTLGWAPPLKTQSHFEAMDAMNQFKLIGPAMSQAPPPQVPPPTTTATPVGAAGPSSAAAAAAAAVAPSAPSAPSPDGEAPPPYTTMPRSPSEMGACHWTGPGAGAMLGGYTPRGVKLGYMDFVPRLVRKRILKDNDYESFE